MIGQAAVPLSLIALGMVLTEFGIRAKWRPSFAIILLKPVVGEFESGMTAPWLGVVPSVVVGAIGTLVVVVLWTRLFPSLANIDRLEGRAIVTEVTPKSGLPKAD